MTMARPYLALWFIGLAALTLRVGAIVALQAWENPNPIEHRDLAISILEGRGMQFTDWKYYGPSSVQSPTYPLILAGLFAVFGTDTTTAYTAALLLNAVLGAATAVLVGVLALRLGAARSVALVAATMFAVWPTQVYAVTHAQAIGLITLAVVALLILFDVAVRTGRRLPWAGFSAIGCVAALTEPVLLIPMALTGLLIFVWRAPLTIGRRAQFAAILFLAAMLILLPWTLRNRYVHGEWIPVKSTFWVNVWKANNDHSTGTDRQAMTDEQRQALAAIPLHERDELARDPQFDAPRQYGLLTREQVSMLRGKPEATRERVFRTFAMTWIREHPRQYARLCGLRLVKTLWLEWDNPKAFNAVYLVARTTMLALFIIGLPLMIARRWLVGYALFVFGMALLVYTLTITAARFILPLEPVMMCAAALAIVTLVQRLASLLGRSPAAGFEGSLS